MKKSSASLSVLLVPVMFIMDCASVPTIYKWDGYQEQVSLHLTGKAGPEQQIIELEKNLSKIQANGKTPPGYMAHLGLLYAEVGNDGQAKKYFQTEKELFPESAPFMNYLLAKISK